MHEPYEAMDDFKSICLGQYIIFQIRDVLDILELENDVLSQTNLSKIVLSLLG